MLPDEVYHITAVAGFYRKAGFKEASIAHVPMEKILSVTNN